MPGFAMNSGGLGSSKTAKAWGVAMLEEGAKKSEEYWQIYKETPLQHALDPTQGILAFPPPPHPQLEPALWMQTQAEARLSAGMAAASKPL
eukprot:COSAG02_NODE_43684_length_372_cov_1.304029_1_plen_90_part_01